MATNKPSPLIPLVHKNDLKCLSPGSRLSDAVINPYIKLLEQRTDIPEWKVLGLDTFFYPCLARGRQDIARRRFKVLNPFEYDTIIIPIFVEEKEHWALAAVFPKENRIQSYDSLGFSHKKGLYQIFEAFKKEAASRELEFCPSAWHIQDTSGTCPRQVGDTDCGVFVLWFAERLARGDEVIRIPRFNPNT
ncbi:sentrin-specific protease 1-like [Macrosteles quadrilineatus]|uniref:sentrin-specific protease 1-like n=1 Tax=Macrosteles quadrilineatus TaxID=74068 RepID=UPI0023E13273|nr:sentrin-specific protease 1-like [Macrosteles quadrilineatus]